ncbi:hypothetical protein F4774DRAFT_426238, partial [Daldinia eschscholtzii]
EIIYKDCSIRIPRQYPAPERGLLYTCKQIRNEVLPIYYKRMDIHDTYLEEWLKLLKKLGPRNLSFVRELDITYSCLQSSDPWDNFGIENTSTCNGGKYHMEEVKQDDKWAEFFGFFKEARPELHLLKVGVSPCEEYYRPLDTLSLLPGRRRGRCDAVGKIPTYRFCRVYHEMNFQKHLLFFSNARKILLTGQFNPLWSLLLAREHGSIVKRFRDAIICCGSYYHIENLNPEYKMDLKGFTESNKMKGVYYEDMSEWSRELRLEEIPIQKSALEVIADKTKKPLIEGDDELETFEFSNDEDDQVYQWDFPNFQFVKEVVPRITQASLVTENA